MAETGRAILAHGFTQTSRSWDPIRARLAARLPDVETVAVDLPGHGDSADVEATLWGAADHLVQRGGPGTYVGYSMGGRVCLHAALSHPESVERLVLIGATAGIPDPGERDDRRRADERLADDLEDVGVERFVDEWLTNPLFAGLDAESSMRGDRLRNTATGLASSLRLAGTGTQEPLWERLGEIDRPTLVLAGEHDAKFRDLGIRLTAALPQATMTIVSGAGHSVHLEQPDRTVDAIIDWW